MATSPKTSPAAEGRQESTRITLARAASSAALAQPEVTGLDGGTAGVHTTFVGTERLPGVTVMPDGEQYDVALYLTAAPTDLHALAGTIQRSVRSAAVAAQLAPRLGDVHVRFTDLTLPDETTRS